MRTTLRFRQPWRFILPRWWSCWSKTRHAQRTFVSPRQGEWTECYCGLKCYGKATRDV